MVLGVSILKHFRVLFCNTNISFLMQAALGKYEITETSKQSGFSKNVNLGSIRR